jgi:hypothetical protein
MPSLSNLVFFSVVQTQRTQHIYSKVAGYRFLLICLNSWHTAKLYIFGKSRMWLSEISMSSLSSVVTLWDNLSQRSNPYFSIFFIRL